MRYLIIVLCAFTIGSVGALTAATPQAHATGKKAHILWSHKGGKKSKKGSTSTTPPPK